jgi:DNA-directed RNA polymerase specialized sigma24 family protein
MNKNWVLSQESFDALLDWLDSDREQAGIKYEDIRRRLITIFTGRGCFDAEDLADETINRVISKLDEIGSEFTGDRARYFFGVANKVHMEYARRKPPPVPLVSSDPNRAEVEYRCLDKCMSRLSEQHREFVFQYYQAEGRAKIEQRKVLAEKLGIGLNALRIRAYRLRASLQECVEKCVEREFDEIPGTTES